MGHIVTNLTAGEIGMRDGKWHALESLDSIGRALTVIQETWALIVSRVSCIGLSRDSTLTDPTGEELLETVICL